MEAVRKADRLVRRFGRARSGATAIEYAMIAVGISIAVATTVNIIGGNLKTNYFEKVQSATSN